MTKTAVIYARVSSKDQEREGYSIPAQVELFKQYAKTKGLKIVKEYLESESAKDSGRKLFNQMLEYVKKEKINAVIFEKVDRMTRNFKDLVTIYDLMENSDLDIHLIKNSLVLNKNSRSQDRFQLDIHVVLARNYINNLSEEVKKGMKQKLQKGGWGHKAPFGYKNIDKSNGINVIPDENAPYVKKMFALALDGYSITAITNEIRKETKIFKSMVHKALSNPFYIGYMTVLGEQYKGNHEPLINVATFDMVQKKLSSNKNKVDAVDRVFRFSGMLTCECGSKMYGELKKGKYVTYGCRAKQFGKECNAPIKYLSEKKIIDHLQPEMVKLTITQEDKIWIDSKIREMFEQMEEESLGYANKKNNQINKLKDKISRLYDRLDDGIISDEDYAELKTKYQADLLRLRSEYDANTIVPLDIKENFRKLFEPVVNLSKYWLKIDNVSDFQKIMKDCISNLTVIDGKTTVTWTELGKTLYNNADCSDWLSKQDIIQNLKALFCSWYKVA